MRGRVRLVRGSLKLYSAGEWLGQVFLEAKGTVIIRDRLDESCTRHWHDAGACDTDQDPEKPLGDADLTQT